MEKRYEPNNGKEDEGNSTAADVSFSLDPSFDFLLRAGEPVTLVTGLYLEAHPKKMRCKDWTSLYALLVIAIWINS